MKIDDNGVLREMTPKERAEREISVRQNPSVTSIESRVTDLELMLADLIGGAV